MIDRKEARELAQRGVLTLLAGDVGRLCQWVLSVDRPLLRLEADWPSAAAAVVKNPAGRGFLFAMAGRVFGDAPAVVECETFDDAEHHFYTADTAVAAMQMLRSISATGTVSSPSIGSDR